MDAIIIKNVSKEFLSGKKTVVKALDNVSFNVKKGETFGLLGANGAGKTTLISILCGLLERDSGKVEVLGMDLDDSLWKIKPRINIISGFTMLTVMFSVKEYLKYFSMLYSIKDKSRIDFLIKKLDLEDKQNTEIHMLSSGYKQRVLLAKALLNDPEILFMDEPTVGLDISIAIKIRAIISELKEKGTTIIFTSHNLKEVEQLCDRIALISNGHIAQIGTINEIKKSIKRKNQIEVECNEQKGFLAYVKKLAEVNNAVIKADKILIEAKSEKDLEKIMKFAVISGFAIISIRIVEPTLEEAMLHVMEKAN
jgi:ABC-2 type transport system ATP-binding protein